MRDKTHCDPGRTGASGSSDAMGVVHRRARQIVIHHRGELHDIQPTRGQISRHQHLHFAGLEIGQRLRTRTLTEFAIECQRLNTGST